MSKYDDYGEFMVAVINEADAKCRYRNFSSLLTLFHLPINSNIINIIIAIMKIGWPAFKAVCGLLVLGPIIFVSALSTFAFTGIGTVVIAALVVFGGVKAIKLLYSNKTTPLKIYEVGKKYKPRFDSHINDIMYIDNLISEAADELLS